MAHWTCGFEAGDLNYYTSQGWLFSGCTIINTAGRFHTSLAGRGGAYSLQIGTYAYTPVIGTGGRWLHFWVEPWQNQVDNLAVVFILETTNAFTVRFEPTGMVQLRRGAGTGILVGTGSFNPNAPHWIAIEANLANTGGQVTVYVDGVQVAQATGDTTNATAGDWDQVLFDPQNGWFTCIDDIVVTTTAEGQLSEYFCSPMTPDGDDAIGSAIGVPNNTAAQKYQNVDEIPPDSGTSYNEFTGAGTDRYTTTNLGFTPANIHCVTVMAQAARDGTIDQLQTVCATDSAGGGVTEALGTITGLASSGVYSGWQDTFNTDPDTASAWTITGLNDLRIGVKVS